MPKFLLNHLTLCSICKNYPLISLNKDKPLYILIQCSKCGYRKCTSLHNYLNQIKSNSIITQDQGNK